MVGFVSVVDELKLTQELPWLLVVDSARMRSEVGGLTEADLGMGETMNVRLWEHHRRRAIKKRKMKIIPTNQSSPFVTPAALLCS